MGELRHPLKRRILGLRNTKLARSITSMPVWQCRCTYSCLGEPILVEDKFASVRDLRIAVPKDRGTDLFKPIQICACQMRANFRKNA